jgi:hypothetical protein
MSDLLIKQLKETIEKQEKIIEELKLLLNQGEYASVFKVRHKNGLFSSGGAYATFNKKGKTWSNKAGVMRHFSMFTQDYSKGRERAVDYINNCEIIELITIEKVCDSVKQLLEQTGKI